MSGRHIPRAELQASKELDVAISKLLPNILSKLPEDVVRSVNDAICQIMPAPGAKVPADIILQKKYQFLIEGGYITAFTPEQIAEANKEDKKEEIV